LPIFILLLFLFSFTLTAKADIYVIKDKKGNVIRVTNQHQMLKKEKDAGYTITILIEDQKKAKKQVSQFKYNFKEKIDWIKVRAEAQLIEQTIRNQTEHELKYPVYHVLATAYTPDEICCTPYADGYTATGYPAGYGSIAIDPDYGMFRYGDILYVEGYGLGVADDCGSAIKGKHIDVCFNLGELKKADNWGRKNVRVWKIQ
ncbi:MAG TPA: 3D domain-containing protein, partial [Atribacterota bacterium]|nr:3D domain-containing protein [Atribacterota bacterium]